VTTPSAKPSHGLKDFLIRQTLIKIITRCTDTTATAIAMGCVSSKVPEIDAASAGFSASSSTNQANLFQVF
jgi:hypothetical protein